MELYLAPGVGRRHDFPVPGQSEEKAAAGAESESGVWHQQEGLLGKWLDMRCARTLAELLQSDSDIMDCNPPGSSVHRILQAILLEWVAMPSFRGSSWPKDETHVSYVSSTGM